MSMSFWGLTLESGKRYAQKVETAFHVSMAALDIKTADNSDVSVYVGVDKNDFLMCNLSKQKVPQQSLDLNFDAGDNIAFTTKGRGIVHLTGYLAPADDFSGFPDPDSESDEAASEDEEAPTLIPAKIDNKKRKNESPKVQQDVKKSKIVELEESGSEESEEGSEGELESGSDEEEEGEEGMWEDDSGGESDDESDDGEEEAEDEEEEESEEEVVVPTPKSKKQEKQQKTPNNKTPIQNGTPNQKESGKKKNKEEKGQTPKSAKKENQQTPGKAPQTPGKNAQTPGKNAQTPAKTPKTPQTSEQSPVKKTLQGGVVIEDVVLGNGPAAKPGRTVAVYYAGRLKSNNKMFDSSQSGAGFRFRLGKSEVIKGWDVGVQGMKVGGKRKIICPPHMAYGPKGSPPAIPPNSHLVFDVELRAVS